jgi:hypothetical protein
MAADQTDDRGVVGEPIGSGPLYGPMQAAEIVALPHQVIVRMVAGSASGLEDQFPPASLYGRCRLG